MNKLFAYTKKIKIKKNLNQEKSKRKITKKSRRKINNKNNKAGNIMSRLTKTLKSIKPIKLISEKKYVTMSNEELIENLTMLLDNLDNCEKEKLEMYNFIKDNMELSNYFTNDDIIHLMEAVMEAIHFNRFGNSKIKEKLNKVYKILFKKLEKYREKLEKYK